MPPSRSLSLDLDNQWSYLKTHGDAGWERATRRTCDVVVPRVSSCSPARAARSRSSSSARTRRSSATTPCCARSPTPGTRSATTRSTTSRGCTSTPRTRSTRSWRAPRTRSRRRPASRPRGFRGPGFSFSPTRARCWCGAATRYDASTLPDVPRPARPGVLLRAPRTCAADEREAARRSCSAAAPTGFARCSRTAGHRRTARWSRSRSRRCRCSRCRSTSATCCTWPSSRRPLAQAYFRDRAARCAG